MDIGKKIKIILSETFSSPSKSSFVAKQGSKSIILQEGGDYEGQDLRGIDLRGARLDKINLENADLSGALLTAASLKNANLKGAKLDGAEVSNADFTNAITSDGKLMNVHVTIPPKGIDYEIKKD